MQCVETNQIRLAGTAGVGSLLKQFEEAPRAELLLQRAIVLIFSGAVGPGAGARDQRVLRAIVPDQRLGEQPRQLGLAAPLRARQHHERVGLERYVVVDHQRARKGVARGFDDVDNVGQQLLLADRWTMRVATRHAQQWISDPLIWHQRQLPQASVGLAAGSIAVGSPEVLGFQGVPRLVSSYAAEF